VAQRAALAQEEGDEQAADASVAVKEGMNRLELRVREADLDQQRQVVALVQECFELS
jgi:hypothetical protein